MKLVYFLSNRCSYYRSKVLIEEMKKRFDLIIFVAGGLLGKGHEAALKEIKENNKCVMFPPTMANGSTLGMVSESTRIAEAAGAALHRLQPDVVVVWADRYELLPMAMITTFMNIPLVQLQAYETSGNLDDKVRNAVSALADVHFVCNPHALMKGIKSGCSNLWKYGCPSIDIAAKLVSDLTPKGIAKLTRDYVMVLYHPETATAPPWSVQETNQNNTEKIIRAATRFCEAHKLRMYVFGSNNDPDWTSIVKGYENLSVKVNGNLVGEDFLRLLYEARMIIGNSSCGIREASFFGTACVNIGSRQQGRMRANNVIDCEIENVATAMETAYKTKIAPSNLYGAGYGSKQIVAKLGEIYAEEKESPEKIKKGIKITAGARPENVKIS